MKKVVSFCVESEFLFRINYCNQLEVPLQNKLLIHIFLNFQLPRMPANRSLGIVWVVRIHHVHAL